MGVDDVCYMPSRGSKERGEAGMSGILQFEGKTAIGCLYRGMTVS